MSYKVFYPPVNLLTILKKGTSCEFRNGVIDTFSFDFPIVPLSHTTREPFEKMHGV